MAARENFALQMKRELIECFFLSTIKVIRILFEDGFQLKSLPAVTKARKYAFSCRSPSRKKDDK
jgi:hypothetical protein